MNSLNQDIVQNIYNKYISEYIICKKNIKMIKKLFFNKNFYNVYKDIIKNNMKFDCDLYNLSDFNILLCCNHDNFEKQYVSNLMREINKFLHNQNFSSPIFTINTNNFIHLVNIQKNEIITNKILEYYGYKIKKYCCSGNGAEIIQIS